MPPNTSNLGQTDLVWICCMCDGPNYCSILFDLHGIESKNKHSILDDSTLSLDSFHSDDIKNPTFTSSPIKPRPNPTSHKPPLQILNVNCQSLRNKKPTYNLLDSSKPDVIVTTKTWFNSDVNDSEYFSEEYSLSHGQSHFYLCWGPGHCS